MIRARRAQTRSQTRWIILRVSIHGAQFPLPGGNPFPTSLRVRSLTV